MWAPGEPPGPAGWDRRRVGARLLAALAGLQELRGLRARQEAAVRGALATPPAPAAPRGPRAHERLEAVLVALQEQLHRLRRQDLGLKGHLDQLDRQISELQLGVRRTPPEGPDGDSRPSSGFYEMSDGGSLSASCTSVCSDRPSSSPGSGPPRAPPARPRAGEGRPWSAEEAALCCQQAPEEGAGPSRPRPVSTGALERVLLAKTGPPAAAGSVDALSSLLLLRGLGPPPRQLHPAFQRDLVSQAGGEVYLYPSPLHAVALQSPLFALPAETPPRDSPPPPSSQPRPGPSGPHPTQPGPVPAPGAARAYIDRLLARRGLGRTPRGPVGERGPPSQRAEAERRPERQTRSPRRAGAGGEALQRDASGNGLGPRGPVPLGIRPAPSSLWERQRRPHSCIRAGGAPQAQGAAPAGREGTARPPTQTGPGPCVYPDSASSSTAPTGLPTAPQAVKMGSRGTSSSQAPRPGRHPPPPPWGALLVPHVPPPWSAGLRRGPPKAREAPGRSCSEGSLRPASCLVPAPVAGRADPGVWLPREGARPRQRRWRSSGEIAARARLPGAQGPRPARRRGGGPWAGGPRARLWPPPRAPPAVSGSGSEHSDGCASPFPSSEDLASDPSAGRLGDGESSGSEAGSGVQDMGGRLAGPKGSPPPPPPPAPRLCRIKASKALKRKICRFQPSALKVMTLV